MYHWFIKDVLFFIGSISPILLWICNIMYFTRKKGLTILATIKRPLTIISLPFVIFLSLILNILFSAVIERSILDHYEKRIGQVLDPNEKIICTTTPWYAILTIDNCLVVGTKNDTITYIITH